MTYNTRVFAGVAAILLMAVVFAQPAVAANPTMTYISIVGLNDVTQFTGPGGVPASMITNPGFEDNKVADGTGTTLINGWSTASGAAGSLTINPTESGNGSGFDMAGSTGNVMPSPLPVNQGFSPSTGCVPVGFTMDSSGSQVLGTWNDAFISQTVHKSGSTAFYTTLANQTYVMTWEFGYPNNPAGTGLGGTMWGFTAGLFYSGSSAFCMLNDDTNWDTSHTGGQYFKHTDGVNQMYQFAWSFATNACTKNYVGKTLTFRLGGSTSANTTSYNYFDNIHVYANITPEPSTLALLVTGALGMLAYAWRRKRRK
jgi:hypothetical protein